MYDFNQSKMTKKVTITRTVYVKRNVHQLSEIWSFICAGLIILIGCITHYNIHAQLPKPLGSLDLLHSESAFITDRAWQDLRILTSFGPRTTGSYSNEVMTVDFLKREVSHIKQTSNKNQRIELDVQTVCGSFWRVFTNHHGITSVYRNIQNVVVKLHGEAPAVEDKSALLVNCHFDSVPGSPGASDDAANCVLMLELLRVLSRQNDLNKHSIIFLFNGAEETGLQASHGFITKHKWAKEVKAFINLESVGSGGKEVLFQCSTNGYWLINLYGKSTLYPYAQVVAEELFQFGLIPSDTDFRIFQQYGQIPGLDFAYFVNGYRYHTKFDHIDYISKASLQHTGHNMLELVKTVANSEGLSSDYRRGSNDSMVYYDVLGQFLVSYSVAFSKIFNYGIVSLAVIIPYIYLSQATVGLNIKYIRYEIFLGFLTNMVALVLSCAIGYGIAYDLDNSGNSMSWYSNPILCVPIYGTTTVFVQCVLHLIRNGHRIHNAPLSIALLTQARLIGSSLFWGVLAAAITSAGLRSAYTIVVPLLITLITNIVNTRLRYQNSIHKWLYVHVLGQLFVIFWGTNFYNMITEVFIPTLGRSGGKKNADVTMAMICSAMTLFITSYLTPIVAMLRRQKNFLISLFSIYIITRYYIIPHTRFGFPYTDDQLGEPRVQRHYMTHTLRTLYDREGKIRYTDSGFWFLNIDRNARRTIESLTMPETPIPQDENILCKNEISCGLPIISPRQLDMGGFWVSGPAPIIRDAVTIKLVSHVKVSPRIHRLHFVLTGQNLISLQLRPKELVKLHNWNVLDVVPEPNIYNKQKTYFVLISHGIEAGPFNITLELKTAEDNFKRSLIDISLVSKDFDYHKDHTDAFANMLIKLPQWAYAIPSVAWLQMWTF